MSVILRASDFEGNHWGSDMWSELVTAAIENRQVFHTNDYNPYEDGDLELRVSVIGKVE